MALRFPRLRFILPLALLVLLTFSGTAQAAADCRQQVIDDWSADGRVDRVYPLDCYQRAVESLAPDIRDYTDAQESIESALTLALRAKGQRPPSAAPARSLAAVEQVEPNDGTPVPIPLIMLAAFAGTTLLAGGLALVGHRARKR